jgi:hypothetical protein
VRPRDRDVEEALVTSLVSDPTDGKRMYAIGRTVPRTRADLTSKFVENIAGK